jgi:hypothetical protein
VRPFCFFSSRPLLVIPVRRSYYDEHCKNDNSAIFSILCLATKYDVALLRKRLLAHFTEAVPQSPSLSQWDAASKRRASVGSITCAELDIIAVKVARELDVPALLPCALFRCALGPLDSIAHGVTAKDGRHFQLDAQDKQACFVAREHVREIVYGRLAEWSYPNDEDWETSCSSRSCRGAVTYVMTQLLGNRARMESCCFLALDDHLLEIQKSFAKTICSVDTDEEKTCEEVFRDQWDTTRSNVWNHVPSFFGFVDWRTVQAASDIV